MPTASKYNDYPRLGSVVGYSMVIALAAGIKKAGSTDTEKLITAFEGLEFTSPFGKRHLPRRSTTSRPWAPSSARPRSRTARA